MTKEAILGKYKERLGTRHMDLFKGVIFEAMESYSSSLLKENEELKRLLQDLTPGGSEFYNDPKYCAEWVRKSREENHYALANQIKNLKSSNEAKDRECEYWKARCELADKILMRQKELETIGFEWQEYLQLKQQPIK